MLRITDELPKETKKAVRKEIREAAGGIAKEAQTIFRRDVSSDPKKSRYGVSVRRTGTVVVEQRVKSKYAANNKALRRPKFTDLQIDDVLLPAANNEGGSLDEALTNVLERLQRKWVTG